MKTFIVTTINGSDLHEGMIVWAEAIGAFMILEMGDDPPDGLAERTFLRLIAERDVIPGIVQTGMHRH